MAYSIRCPVCRKKFAWDPTEGFPDLCPNAECNSRIAHDRDDDDIVMPFVRSNTKTKATDQVYRDIERSSEHRAQMAQEMTGASAEEVSHIKITDLKPTTHQGDVAAPALPAHLADLGKFAGAGSEFAAGVSSGQVVLNNQVVGKNIAPNAGMAAQSKIQRAIRGF